MSSDQGETTKRLPVEVADWNGLVRYTQLLCQGSEQKIKICVIDEEHEEIRLQSHEEFETNIKCARDHGLKSVTLVVYIDDKHVFDGVYNLEKVSFPSDKLQTLLDNALAERWYIPVKQDEALGICLTAAIHLAQDGKLEAVADSKRFVEEIVPEAFRKLQTTPSVFSWPREIQCGIFEMVELLIDLLGIRLRHQPVPITLLNTLAMAFDTKTAFSQKHKNELLPTRRVYTLKDEDFLREDLDHETFGWLRSLIQRFIAQNGLKNVRLQFEYIDSSNSSKAAMEYNALLKLFSKCHQCINTSRFRLIFLRPIRQAIQYLKAQKTSDVEFNELNETLIDICSKYDLKAELHRLTDNSNLQALSSLSIEPPSEATPLIELSIPAQRKSKNQDCYERLAEDIRALTMSSSDLERKNVKKQRTDEQLLTPLFTRHTVMNCIDELLTSNDKRTLKRKHRREQQRATLTSSANATHNNKKEIKRSNTITLPTNKTYDRSNPEDILRYFAPMKLKVATLYDNLQLATSNGNLREVIKLEEKLKLLHPFSARFIADENTPDGTPMKPGEVFRKAWVLFNDGSMPWDSQDIQLLNLADGIEILQQPVVPVTAPHARAVISIDFKCANKPGVYESKWILAYRHQTFGPMIWCSIEVGHSATAVEKKIPVTIEENLLNDFEFVEVPLPACFDLTKPFQPTEMKTSSSSSLFSSLSLPRSHSTESSPTYPNILDMDNLQSSYISDSDSLSNFMYSPPIPTEIDEPLVSINSTPEASTALIELEPTIAPQDRHEEEQSPRLNQPLDFVDTMVTNIFSVAKQASSTAKAIFQTLQAFDEPSSPVHERPTLVNTFNLDQTNTNGFFEHIKATSTSVSSRGSTEPMKVLIEMGFANRAKNQRLLRENANDLAKVIELLTLETNDDVDSFTQRH